MLDDATAWLATDYAAWLAAAGFSARTIIDRVMTARRLMRLAGVDDPRLLEPRHVTYLVGSVAARHSRVTYYHHAASLSRFCEVMLGASAGFMAGVPRPRAYRGTPRPISAAELAAAVAVADERACMMLLLAAFAGLRVAEIAAIRGEDVDADNIFVRGKGGTDAMVPTHPLITSAGGSFPRSGWWFRSRLQPETHVQRTAVWAAMKRPLLQVGSTATPHQLRHFYGSQLLANGANLRTVQELLRHRNVSATQVYTLVTDGARRQAVASLSLTA